MTGADILHFIGGNWWWLVFVVPSVLGAMSDHVRESITGILTFRSEQRIRELKAQQQLAHLASDPAALPGVCVHPASKIVPVIAEGEGKPAAWLCTACDAQLPADFAVRQQDLST